MAATDPDRGRRIADAMKRLGYGPTELAKQIGADRSTVHRYREGRPIDPAYLGRLAEVLEMSRAQIIGPGPLDEAAKALEAETRRREGKGLSTGTGREGD